MLTDCHGSLTGIDAAVKTLSGKGSYILVLHLPQDSAFTVGKLGHYALPAGFYAYVGSALGPGGLRGRLGYHLRPVRRPRWHLDYLRRDAMATAVWWSAAGTRREHVWAAWLRQLPGAGVVVPRFGASDCTCVSHLFHYLEPPSFTLFRAWAVEGFPDEAVQALALEDQRPGLTQIVSPA